MAWLAGVDEALFFWINHDLANSFFDGLMPLISSKRLLPVGFLMVALFALRMGRRGLPAIICLAAIIGLGEGLVLSPLKDWFGRPRPPVTLDGVRLIVGLGGSGSMPSAHAANWFCATTVLALFYRPSLFFTLPLAVLVSFSRVYNGVHYPADVVVGGMLGAAYGYVGVQGAHWAWHHATRRWFPRAFEYLPSILPPKTPRDTPRAADEISRSK
jgi:undecaprenyl-diphosphatase